MKWLKYFFILIIFFLGCYSNFRDISSIVKPEILDDEIYSKFMTVNDLRIVYSDEKTLSIKYYDLENRKISFLDKVDNEPKTNILCGKHLYFLLNGIEYLFYIDNINEKKNNFKLITKKINQDNWEVFLNNIKPIEFSGFSFNENIFLITYSNEINFFYLVDNNLKEVEFKDKERFIDKDIKNIKCFLNKDILFLFYIINKELFLTTFTITQKENTFSINLLQNEIKIYNNVECYNVNFYKDRYYVVFYDNSKFILNIYNSNDKSIKKIGYFLNIFSIEVVNNNEELFIIYSSLDTKKVKDNRYYISLIYNKSYIWAETLLSYFDYPVFNIKVKALLKSDKIRVIGSGNTLFTFDIDLKKIKK